MATDTLITREEPTAGVGSHANTARLFTRSVRAEWVKLRSIRSFYGCVLTTIGLSAALAAFLAWAIEAGEAEDVNAVESTVWLASGGVTFGQIAFLVLAALMITGEYSTGAIRSTLAAAPVRGILLSAKAVVLAAVAAVTCVLSILAGTAVSGLVASGQREETTLALLAESTGHTIIAVALFALLVLSLGVLIRSTAATVAVTVAVIFAPAIISGMASNETVSEIVNYLPAALQDALLMGGTNNTHEPMTAGLLLAAWAGATLIAAGIVLTRRDA